MPRHIAEEEEWEDAQEGGVDEASDDSEPTIACPYCKRQIHEDSPRCPHCEQVLPESSLPNSC